jgi:hypothetical protein
MVIMPSAHEIDNPVVPKPRLRHRCSGAVIVEALAAAMIIGLFMGGLFEMNAFNVRTVRAAKETVAGSLVLQERLDQVRNTKWTTVSDTTYLQSVLSTAAASSGALPQLTEQITVSAYPAVSPTPTPAVVTRAPDGTTAIVSSNSALSSLPAVRADVTISWLSSPRGKTRTRTLCTIIAEGGIVR